MYFCSENHFFSLLTKVFSAADLMFVSKQEDSHW